MKEKEPVQIYQIKITLDDIRPPIWRRVLVPSNTNLSDLHTIIQAVFSWLDYHLHVFKVNGIEYSDPAVEDFAELDFQDETKVNLGKLGLREKSKFSYQYDFGDSWDHSLLVEKILPFEKGVKLPRSIAGKRSRPPEDVGGRGGMRISWKRSAIQRMRSMTVISFGQGEYLTLKHSILRQPMWNSASERNEIGLGTKPQTTQI
jgi:hypothetical protein